MLRGITLAWAATSTGSEVRIALDSHTKALVSITGDALHHTHDTGSVITIRLDPSTVLYSTVLY